MFVPQQYLYPLFPKHDRRTKTAVDAEWLSEPHRLHLKPCFQDASLGADCKFFNGNAIAFTVRGVVLFFNFDGVPSVFLFENSIPSVV